MEEALSADADLSSPNDTHNSSSILRRASREPHADSSGRSCPQVVTFSNDTTTKISQNNDTAGKLPPAISAVHRNISNQSTIDSALSGNSHLDADDPSVRRMFGLPSSRAMADEKKRRVELIIDQCENVRFPFKKRLVLANLDLYQDDVPVETICSSDRLGSLLYKLSLARNPLCSVPSPLVLKLAGLRVLDLSQCSLLTLPERWDLPNLKRLNLSHNKLQEFPNDDVIGGLPDLQVLELYGNNFSRLVMSKDATTLSKLDYLDVGCNNLTALPDSLTQFHSLKTFKCSNNLLEIIPAAVCEMELRVFDVSSNPLVQPPLETCERGLYSMRRYYGALKLEEMVGPESSQANSVSNNKKAKHEKSRSKMRKKKDFTKRIFPSSLRPSCVFRSVSTESGNSLQTSADSLRSVKASELSTDNPIHRRQSFPVKSVSIHHSSNSILPDTKNPPHSDQVIYEEETEDEKQLEVKYDAESDSDDTGSEDSELISSHKVPLLVGLNNAKKVPGEITVNDTLKIIFVGMAMSGKTSIIKRLIEGREATIPQKDERTVGVDIYNWDPKSRSNSQLSTSISLNSSSTQLMSPPQGDVDVTFSMWDFAGQHVYHVRYCCILHVNKIFSTKILTKLSTSHRPRTSFSSRVNRCMVSFGLILLCITRKQYLFDYIANLTLNFSVLVWDMGANNPDTSRKKASFNRDEQGQGAFKLTYDSSDEEDDDFFDSEQQIRRARRALEQDIDEKLQFWIDCIQSCAPGAAILPIASYDDCLSNEEATLRCQIMKERLRKHEEKRVNGMKQRLKEYDSTLGVDSEQSLRLRRLLSAFNRPKIIFGDTGPSSVVRVSSTKYTGFTNLASRIVNIATGRERGGWTYPIFRGHIGARIPRMRLEVRDVVRSMRDRFKVVEWNFFLSELEKKGIEADQADVSDALKFLASVGELSYFGEVSSDRKNANIHSQSVFDEEESGSISPMSVPTRHISVDSSTNSSKEALDSLSLSDFIFLNPRWLVAAVACILRHDLSRELIETKRNLRDVEHLIGEEDSSYSFHDDDLLATDVSYPVITSQDTKLLWQAKRFTKKAAERALQYSNKKVDPFDFLQRLLIKFGVFVPVDLSVEKAFLGGRDYSVSDVTSHLEEFVLSAVAVQSPKYFFLPSLLGPGEPSDIWTYKTSDSWKAVISHSILFPDGVPPGLMERITAYVLSDMYTNAHSSSLNNAQALNEDLSSESDGESRIKEMLCWRSAFYLKMGQYVLEDRGEFKESIVEIFVTLVDDRSQLCVSTDTMSAGMRRLIFSAKGNAGNCASNIYAGGYKRVIERSVKHVTNEYSGVEFERQAVCPQCLAKKPCSLASVWDHSFIESAQKRGEQIVRCRYGHVSDIRLICGTSAPSNREDFSDIQNGGDADAPVADILKAVVIVGLYDEKAQRIVRAGSGVIVDKKRGFIVTAGHTLMDKNTWREIDGKIVIGVIPQTNDSEEPIAVFRYFARIIARDPSIDESDKCRVDACVLQITTRMESDVLDDGREIGERPEILLMNNPDAMKRENLPQLKLARRFELDEAVRILGFNQGGEGLISIGEVLNRRADFARGYVVMRFSSSIETSMNRNFLPNEEIVVICPTIGGHSGGPCVNQSGEVIGILSRADPSDPQRCYLVPSTEFKTMVRLSKRRLKLTVSETVPLL